MSVAVETKKDKLKDFAKGLEALSCPKCGTKIVLTKEKILFCQSCLSGYRLNSGIPDLRASEAINFKKLRASNKNSNNPEGKRALFTVLPGKKKQKTFEVKQEHCVVLGRSIMMDENLDITYVGQGPSKRQLDHSTRNLIDKMLYQSHESQTDLSRADKFLGGFHRDEDILLEDKSVSRSHALLFQDHEGVWLLDLVSKNGSYINGVEVEKAKLKNNDVINIGAVSMRVNIL